MKNKTWYLGYVVAIVILVAIFFADLDNNLTIVLTFVFGIILSVTHIKLMHQKMIEKDKDYKIQTEDERNTLIKDKANAANSAFLLLLVGLATIILLVFEYYIPALIVGSIIPLNLAFLVIVSNYYEKNIKIIIIGSSFKGLLLFLIPKFVGVRNKRIEIILRCILSET